MVRGGVRCRMNGRRISFPNHSTQRYPRPSVPRTESVGPAASSGPSLASAAARSAGAIPDTAAPISVLYQSLTCSKGA